MLNAALVYVNSLAVMYLFIVCDLALAHAAVFLTVNSLFCEAGSKKCTGGTKEDFDTNTVLLYTRYRFCIKGAIES